MKLLRNVLLISCLLVVASMLTTGQVHQGCLPTADVMFLLDGSDSISTDEFQQQIELMSRFVNGSHIGPENIRVGFSVVSTTIGDEFPVAAGVNKDAVMAGIFNLTQPQEGSRTDLGLVQMEQMLGKQGRRGVLKIGVIMTDGRAKFEKATENEAAVVKNSGVFLIAIGVGRLIKFAELEKIASTTSNAYSLVPLDISSKLLTDSIEVLGRESCAGNAAALLDLLKPETNPTMKQIADMPFKAMSENIRQSVGIPNSEKPGVLSNTQNKPSQINPDTLANNQNTLPQINLDTLANSQNTLSKINLDTMVNSQNTLPKINLDTLINSQNTLPKISLDTLINSQHTLPQMSQDTLANSQNIPAPDILAKSQDIPSQINPDTLPNSQNIPTQIIPDTLANNQVIPAQINPDTLANSPNIDTQMNPDTLANSQNILAQINPDILSNSQNILAQINPDTLANNQKAPSQVVIPGMNFPDKNFYEILNKVGLPSQFLEKTATNINLIEQIPTRVTTETIPRDSLATNPGQSASTGFGINFNGGIADPMPVIQALPAGGVFGPEKIPTSGLNIGVPLKFSEPSIQIPVMKETFVSAVKTERYTTAAPNGILTPPAGNDINKPKTEMQQDQCSKGRYVNGIGLTFVPGSCTNFLQCIRENGKTSVEVARCPFETFFDERSAVCRFHGEQSCWRDPCSQKGTNSYKHPGNCRAYWDCKTGSSKPACCPLGSSFNPDYGCVRNVTCQDTCMDFGNINEVVSATKCRLLPMESNDKFFFERVSGVGWMVRSCPPGSRFNPADCNCNKPDKIFKPSCRPELYLTFEDGVYDKSGNQLAMGNENVGVEFGSGEFNGRSHLTLWRFSGVTFGQKLKITFRFRTSVWAPKNLLMHVVSNCCYKCGYIPKPSIDIAIIPGDDGGVAVFRASTDEAGETFIFVHYEDTFTGWNRLTFTYDGATLSGTVNSITESKKVIGDIQLRPDPLMIGACSDTGPYQGLLDDFEFYMCTAQ